MTTFPKDGSWFATEEVTRTVYRWRAYKPQAVKQMGKPGRWQRQVWNGGFFKWENSENPQGALCEALESVGPISAAWERANAQPKAVVKIDVAQSNDPVPSHGGLSVNTYWSLVVNGIKVLDEHVRHVWETDLLRRQKYMEIRYCPSAIMSLHDKLTEALMQPQEKT